jgi:DNA polymerase-3 subunit gamma/tau
MARHKRLHVEMALIKMCYIQRAVKAAQAGPAFSATPVLEKKTSDGDVRPASTAPGHPSTPPAGQPISTGAESHAGAGPGMGISPVPPPRSNAQELTEAELAEVNHSLKRGLKKAVSLNLGSYEQAVEIEEAEKAALESRLTLENAELEWALYCESVDSPSLRQAMTNAALRLHEKTLVATVGLSLHRNSLQNELTRLRDTLRHRLHDAELKIHVTHDERLNEANQPAKPQRPLTREERLRVLQENYPLVSDLVQRLGLKLED